MAEFKLNDKVGTDRGKDNRILSVCKKLTEKGYITKASCEGHPDEIKLSIHDNGDVYAIIDAYISFTKHYEFKSLPKHWYQDGEKCIAVNYDTEPNTDEDGNEDPITRTIKVQKLSNIDKNADKTKLIDKLSNDLRIMNQMKNVKSEYMNTLEQWVESLPVNKDDESLNEATSATTRKSPNAEKREKITKFLTELYTTLENGGTQNIDKFLEQTKKMSDSQFIAMMRTIVDDPTKHLYAEFEAFENEPNYEIVEKAANDIVGEEYTHLYDYIAFPHLSSDPNHPKYTVHKIFNGYINMRRVQQLVNSKNHIPTHTDKRDPKTNQVAFESKAARVSDVEQFAMICHGTKNILKEFFGPRGGDPVMRDEMAHQIATSGSARLSEMHDSKLNKTSLNTANVYLIAAGLESDLVTKNGILPRTLMKQYKEANVLNRDNVR